MKRQNRLLKDQDFQAVLARKIIEKKAGFILYALPQNKGLTRIGLSVSKKLGGAVERNKIRRQIRMMITNNLDLTQSIDHLVIVRSEYLKQTFIENQKQLLEGLLNLRRKS